MSAATCKAATIKENLTVQMWGIDGPSVVKDSLTTAALRRADLNRLLLATCKRRLQVRMGRYLGFVASFSYRSQIKTGDIK